MPLAVPAATALPSRGLTGTGRGTCRKPEGKQTLAMFPGYETTYKYTVVQENGFFCFFFKFFLVTLNFENTQFWRFTVHKKVYFYLLFF